MLARLRILLFTTILLMGGLLACQSKPVVTTNEWAQKMETLYTSFVDMIPYIYNGEAYRQVQNREHILRLYDKLTYSVHIVEKTVDRAAGAQDPILKVAADEMNANIEYARFSFEKGYFDYSRGLMQYTANQCFQCHTRANVGPAFGDRHLNLDQLNLDSTEKADIYIATRQYGFAQKILETTIDNASTFDPMPMDLEESLYLYMALMIRIQQQPRTVIDRLEKLLRQDNLPLYFRRDLEGWVSSLKRWETNLKRGRVDGDEVHQARQLVKEGDRLRKRPTDRSGDVAYLRATAILHRFLQKKQDSKLQAEAYYLLGTTYENLRRYGGLDLYKAYYRACVEADPKGSFAQKCYERYEENAYVDFWEGGAQFSAEPLRKRLKTLKELIK